MSILGKVHFEIFIKFSKIQKIFVKNIDTKLTQRSELVFNYHNAIEILRDIQDNIGVPIVLVGMGMLDKKIARYKTF